MRVTGRSVDFTYVDLRGYQGEPAEPTSCQVGAGAPPNALFDELLHAARELLAVRSPLDAELLVSDLLGTWWPQRHHTIGGTGIEQLIGEGLVEYAAQQRSPAALALLSGIACLGTPRQAAAAEQAAITLIDAGVRTPGWAEHLGAVSSAECYVNPDAWGDQDEVICVFSYAGEEPHALVSVIDYNLAGMLRDGWVSSQVDKLLEHCRRPPRGPGQPARKTASGRSTPPEARKMLQAALDGHRRGRGPAGQRLLRRPARLHQVPYPGAAARPRPGPAQPSGPPGRRSAGRCWPPSSSPPTRPRSCPTCRPRAASRT